MMSTELNQIKTYNIGERLMKDGHWDRKRAQKQTLSM